jgi:hypothetical protein
VLWLKNLVIISLETAGNLAIKPLNRAMLTYAGFFILLMAAQTQASFSFLKAD